ncbi:LysR family transcriptional regulator [Herbiconiux flava]|nr:LysR family transcriptional regulator [Herbiconiux flava]GLK17369.1 LysR family transcriptional regulator [Herbiconiux flava]
MLAALQRLGTIAAVADELHLTAPGVSMQLAALERELGLALTQRQGRRVVLTAAGAVLAQHGHGILDQLSMAELELEALRSGSVGHYTLTAFPSAARTFVADVCRSLLTDPGSGLDLTLSTLEPEAALAALTAGAVDLAVIHSYSNVARELPRGAVANALGSEPVRLAVGTGDRRPLQGGAARLGDYNGAPWIVPTADVTCYSMVERACGLAGFRPRIVAETMDFGVQLELVAAGVGVALVPSLTVDRLPDGVVLHDLTVPVERTLFLATRQPNANDPGIRTLGRLLADAAAERLTASLSRAAAN